MGTSKRLPFKLHISRTNKQKSTSNVAEVQDFNKEVTDDFNNRSNPPTTDKPTEKESAARYQGKDEDKNHPLRGSVRSNLTFSWKNVGSWEGENITDKEKSVRTLKSVQNYIIDHFYGDWYWNTVIVVGTCFFSWFVARSGGGLFALMFVLLCTSSVYRSEFRRFNRDVRDDLSRIMASNRLENELETMEWLNSFLDKFWRIYMPALSEQVTFQANLVMKDLAPGYGIEKVSLDEFTLGSKAPRIDSIKSYTKKGADHVEMDWAFLFTPTDTDGFTKKALKEHISPKVLLGVTVGKAFVSKKLPIVVENMSGVGRMNVKLKLCNTFPHIQTVSLQFLEPPNIDYGLKPVGGDTLGIDIMSFIPGLSNIVNGIIHSTLRPMLYAPNSFDINVADFLPDLMGATGFLAVKIRRCYDLKNGPKSEANSLNPYVELNLSNNLTLHQRTKVKKSTNDPVFMEIKHLLLSSLDPDTLDISVFNLTSDKPQDELIGEVHFPLSSLIQKESQNKVTKYLYQGGKVSGKIEFDLNYFPTIPPKILDDGTREVVTDIESGILKFTLHEARDLDITQSVIGILNPYAEIYLNHKLAKLGRQLHSANEPSWDQGFESLITEQSKTRVQVYIKDAANGSLVGKLDSNIQDLIFETNRGQGWITQPSVKKGGKPAKFRVTADWKALNLRGLEIGGDVASYPDAPIGALKVHLRYAQGVKNVESVGYSDPYIRVLVNGNLKLKTAVHNDTLNPIFNHVAYLGISNEHQHILLQMMDDEEEGKDRPLGSSAIHVADYLKRDANGLYLPYEGGDKIIETPVLSDGVDHGTLYYSVAFYPTIPLYTQKQLLNWDQYMETEDKKNKEINDFKQNELELAKKFPDDYQWVETNEVDVAEPKKKKFTFDEVSQYNGGVVVATVSGGNFDRSDVFVHILFDDQDQSTAVSQRVDGRRLESTFQGEGFIRDLPLSNIILRIGKKIEMTHKKELVAEKSFSTLDILKRSYDKPISLKVNERNSVQIQLEYIPVAVKLDPFDTVLDQGIVKLDIVSAENLKSVDLNGKSDPLCLIRIDGKEVFKTDKKRKTLDPTWNASTEFPVSSRSRQAIKVEVYDWDLTHDDELLGIGNLDLTGLKDGKTDSLVVPLDTQGKVSLKASFHPKYIRPQLSEKVYVPVDLAGAGAGIVSSTGAIAGNISGGISGVAGSAGGVADKASDGLNKIKGLGGFGRSKKNKHGDADSTLGVDTNSVSNVPRGSSDQNASIVPSSLNGGSSSPVKNEGSSSSYRNGGSNSSIRNGGSGSTPGPGSPVKNGGGFDPNKSVLSDQSSAVNDSFSVPKPGFGGSKVGTVKNGSGRNGHLRTLSSSTDASSFIGSTTGATAVTGSLPGRVTVITGKGFDLSALEVKILLQAKEKKKDLLKTRGAKKDDKGLFHWNELIPFKSSTDADLVFSVREKHTFGKSQELGTGLVKLAAVLDRESDLEVPVGSGSLTINVRYLPVSSF